MIHLAVAAILYLNIGKHVYRFLFRLLLLYCREYASVLFR